MIFDPIGHRVLRESAVEVLDPIAGLIPFRPLDRDYWLVQSLWTGETRRLFDLEEDVELAISRRIYQHVIVQRIQERCETVRSLKQAPPMIRAEAEFALQEALNECAEDRTAVQVGRRIAQARGFSPSEIAFSLLTLNDEVALHEALDGVEVISVSSLVAQMRTTEAD